MTSKRRLRKKTCQRKVRYTTEQEARAGAIQSYNLFQTTIHPYHCRFCNGYHLGHPPREIRDIMEQKGVVL